jgi:hypothetical protein
MSKKTKKEDELPLSEQCEKVLRLFAKGREKYAQARSLLKKIAPDIGAGNVIPISETKGIKLIDRFAGEKATKPTVIDRWELKEVTL